MTPDWRPQLASIEDCVAEDNWSFTGNDGVQRIARIRIGRPFEIPNDTNGDWCCPVWVEELLPRVKCVVGVGPVDALMNAANFAKKLFESFTDVTPRADR